MATEFLQSVEIPEQMLAVREEIVRLRSAVEAGDFDAKVVRGQIDSLQEKLALEATTGTDEAVLKQDLQVLLDKINERINDFRGIA